MFVAFECLVCCVSLLFLFVFVFRVLFSCFFADVLVFVFQGFSVVFCFLPTYLPT